MLANNLWLIYSDWNLAKKKLMGKNLVSIMFVCKCKHICVFLPLSFFKSVNNLCDTSANPPKKTAAAMECEHSKCLNMLFYFWIFYPFFKTIYIFHLLLSFQVANNQRKERKKSYCSLILFTFWLFILFVVTQPKALCFNIQIHVKSCNKLFFVWRIKKK